MAIKFDRLKDVNVRGVNLESDRAVGIAIGKAYGVREIPVRRVRTFYVKGKLIDLPDVVYLYMCKVPLVCTAVVDSERKKFYFIHNIFRDVLEPILEDDVSSRLESIMKDLEELPKEDLRKLRRLRLEKEIEEEIREPYFPEVRVEKLPSVEEISRNPRRVLSLPKSLQIRFGNRVYDKRWYRLWKAKLMALGRGYKKLYNPAFLSLRPEQMLIDAYAPYLVAGRWIEKAIDDIDLAMLGITDEDLGRWR